MSESNSENRANYLKQCWRAFPSAEIAGCTPDDFLHKGVGCWVGGRLTSDSGRWSLFSDGTSVPIEFTSQTDWRAESNVSPVRFDSGILRAGDHVLLYLEQGQPARVREAQLLVPAGEEAFQLDFSFETGRRWARFLSTVRAWFAGAGFTEVPTPYLVPSPGTEPYLEPFQTEYRLGRLRCPLYLPTSPEFHLKKLLVAGWTRVFEIKTCFRNGESGPHHQPEFTMLEWYRAYSDLGPVIDDIRGLLRSLAPLFPSLDIPELQVTTVATLFQSHLDFSLRSDTSVQELRSLCSREGITFGEDDTWDDLFFRLFLEKIEFNLGQTAPLIVRDYPPSQAALARVNGRSGWADRFELYWRGLEIANAFNELNDPEENLQRFSSDNRRKKELGLAEVPIDTELVHALRSGLPPTGGIALGLERLYMALSGESDIARLRPFPLRT